MTGKPITTSAAGLERRAAQIDLQELPTVRRDLIALAKAERGLNVAVSKKAKGQWRTMIRVLKARIERARTERADALWAGAANAESANLAEARGEDVETVETDVSDWVRDEHGVVTRGRGRRPVLRTEKARAVRVASRTGLQLAFERGALDGGRVNGERLYALGQRYREAFEIANGSLGADRDPGEASAKRCTPSTGPQDRVLEATRDLAEMRHGLSRDQCQALDLVCGQDFSVKAAARASHMGAPAMARYLRGALYLVGETLLWW